MKKLSIFMILLVSALFSELSSAASCYCYADIYSKQYPTDGIQDKWYGAIRKWSCNYTCVRRGDVSSGDKKEIIRGHHVEKYFGSDDGSWAICDGLIYRSIFNPNILREVYMIDDTVPVSDTYFNPKKSKSPDLKKWSAANCSSN